MKFKIILGLSIISALLCFASGLAFYKCVPFHNSDLILKMCRDEWKIPGKHLSNDTSEESRNGDMNCFTKCLYEKLGIFYDHQFHEHMIREIMIYYVHHPLIAQLTKLLILAAEATNVEGGDDCQMANEFWEYNNEPEFKELKLQIFCDRDPWLNPE